MSPRRTIMGLFTDEFRAVSALKDLKQTRFTLEDVYSPIPSEEILEALNRPKSKVGYFTLVGGIIGFFSGIGLSIHTAVQWDLVVSGKPIVAMAPFFIVGFEFAVLFAVFGNILGLVTQARLPRFQGLARHDPPARPDPLTHHDPRCTGGHFGILVSCVKGQESDLAKFFRQRGGEAKTFD